MSFITDFGDSAVVLPLAMAVLVSLLWSRWFKAALAWGLVVVGCASLMLVLKLVFLACPVSVLQGVLLSPSGHAAMSATVYGGMAGLLASQCRREWMVVTYAVTHMLVMAIALSLIAVRAHSPLEVMVGLGLGTVFATLFTLSLGPRLAGGAYLPGLGIGAALVLTATHGAHFQIESVLMLEASRLHGLLCP